MLTVQHLQKLFYAGTADERIAIDGVSLTLAPGDFAGGVAGNAAGKSPL